MNTLSIIWVVWICTLCDLFLIAAVPIEIIYRTCMQYFFFHEGSNNNWLKYWMDPSLAGLKLNAFNWDRWTSIYWWLSFLGQPNIGSNLTYQTIKNAIICSFHIHSLKRTKTLPMQTNLILTSRLIIHTLMNVKKSNR